LTATRWVAGAGLMAAFRAAAMRAKMAARFPGMLMTAARLARQQRRLNAAMSPQSDWPKTIGPKNNSNRNLDFGLVLFTDDSGRDWLAAAKALPRASIIVI